MTEPTALNEFTALVLKNLEKNGFPEKPVSFPLEKLYETASQRGFSFNKVRDALKSQNILSEISGDRVIFTKQTEAPAASADDEGFNIDKMAEFAKQMLDRLSPTQREELGKMVQNLSPEELARIQHQWDSMPSDQKMQAMKTMQEKETGP